MTRYTDIKQLAHNSQHLQNIIWQTKNWLKTFDSSDGDNLCDACKDGVDTLEELYEMMTGEPCGNPDQWEEQEDDEEDLETIELTCDICGSMITIDQFTQQDDAFVDCLQCGARVPTIQY